MFRRHLNVLTALSAFGAAVFVAVFAWYDVRHLVVTTACYGIGSVAGIAVQRITGRAALGREIFLACLYAYVIEMTVFYDAVRTSGSIWLICLPIVAILLGSLRSGLVWAGVTMVSIVALMAVMGGSDARLPVTETEANGMFSISLVLEIACLGIFVMLVDRERKSAMRRLAHANETVRKLALRDPLTGVFNRRHLSELIALDDAKPVPARSIDTVLMIDIDHFKSINDTYGHLTGDDVIRSVADAIMTEAGPDNPVGRFGGEEFVCLILKSDGLARGKAAPDIAEAIRRRISCSTPDNAETVRWVTVSIGLAECGGWDGAQAALKQADVALYAAKAAGRNCVRHAAPPSPETRGHRRNA